MKKFKVRLYQPTYNYDAHRYEFNPVQSFMFSDYDAVQNLIGYMTEGSDDVMIRIETEEVEA